MSTSTCWYLFFPDAVEADRLPFSICGRAETGATADAGPCPVTVFFEGFLYERRRLIDTLRREDDDAGLIAHAWARWGINLLDHLRGRFMVALHDPGADQLLVGHDAMGLHPVYYARAGKGLICSSNIYSIAYSGLLPRRPNRLSLALSTTISHPPCPGETHFDGIFRLEPGHYLLARRAGTPRTTRYWSITPEHDACAADFADSQARFVEHLDRGVQRCMSRNPTGILLSGGMDSISVAGLAARQADDGLPLVACMGRNPPGYPQTEAATQDEVASALGLRRLASSAPDWIGDDDLYARGYAVTKFFPGPMDFWWAGITVAFYAYLREHGIHAVLTGSGGDEWMGVHPAYAADLMRSMRLVRLFHLLRSKAATGNFGWKSAVRTVLRSNGIALLAKAYAPPTCRERLRSRQRSGIERSLASWSSPGRDLREALVEEISLGQFPDSAADQGVPTSFYRGALMAAWRNPRMTWELERHFHLAREIGMDFHHPFHDQDVVRYCNELPGHIFFYKGRNKSMLRPLVRNLFPDSEIFKQRKYFGESKDYLRDQVEKGFRTHWSKDNIRYLADLGVVDRKRLPGSARVDIDFGAKIPLINLLFIEYWCHQHF